AKKYSNREIAQGVGFVAAGIHEALNYLAIVRKVIEKTERVVAKRNIAAENASVSKTPSRSEEHTSELQSRFDLVCRLLLEKKNKKKKKLTKYYSITECK